MVLYKNEQKRLIFKLSRKSLYFRGNKNDGNVNAAPDLTNPTKDTKTANDKPKLNLFLVPRELEPIFSTKNFSCRQTLKGFLSPPGNDIFGVKCHAGS